jgi:energy-coupling factor transport system permease protein
VYERRASPLHAARASVALCWSLVLVSAALAFEHPIVLGALLVAVVGASVAAGVWGSVARMLRWALPFALLIALINPFVVREGLTVIFRVGEVPPFGEIDITLESVVYGAILGLRALVVLMASALLAATVDPDEVLRLFRRVSFRSALTAALAVRLVPVLQRDGRRLADARRLRAGDPPPRHAVLRAVATGALDRAADVAATLEVRGYRSGIRAQAVRAPWSRHDLAFAASALALVLLCVGAHALSIAELTPYPELVIESGTAEWAWAAALVLVALAPFADRRGIAP